MIVETRQTAAFLKVSFQSLLAGAVMAALVAPVATSTLAARADEATPVTATAETPREPIMGGDAPTSTTATTVEPTSFSQGPLFPYTLLDRALAGNVEPDGNVQYSNLKNNKNLEWFLKAVATADIKQFPVFEYMVNDPATMRPTIKKLDRTPELIFWINAYNAHILNTIAQAYPLGSIDSIKGFDTAQIHNVAGKNYSFKELREKILTFGDPRALFSLTTGTAGGFLPSRAAIRYVEFDSRMNSAVRVFVNDPRNVSVNRLQNVVTVNSILKDVSDMFKTGQRKKFEGIRMVLAGYTDGNAKGYMGSGDFRIEFKESDRSLNDKSMRGTSS